MKLHEYQSRQLLQDHGVPVSRWAVVRQAAEAAGAFERIGAPSCMAKVQVLMGGRGKAGGIQKVSSAAQAAEMCGRFLGKPFSTTQSAGESKTVRAMMLAEEIDIAREFYLGAVVDRSSRASVALFCAEGGVDIEEVAARNPSAILKMPFGPDAGPSDASIRSWLEGALEPSALEQAIPIVRGVCRLFLEKDASIVEINPLVLTPQGRVLALDAKVVIDDNALFRHADLKALKDPEEDDERERRAKELGLSYVSMKGNVGCLVNGAGLAMATMDVIQLAGGQPANFLDVGGGATADQVREAFKIILEDERVEAILVNIFGGIMKCDVIAEGIIQACRQMSLDVPLVVRLEGTRVREGRKLLEESGLKILSCTTIKQAAETAVREAARSRESRVDTRR